jgi:hypothetical protein
LARTDATSPSEAASDAGSLRKGEADEEVLQLTTMTIYFDYVATKNNRMERFQRLFVLKSQSRVSKKARSATRGHAPACGECQLSHYRVVADDARKALQGSNVRSEPHLDFFDAKVRRRRAVSHVACAHEINATADARAVHHNNHWLAAFLHLVLLRACATTL